MGFGMKKSEIHRIILQEIKSIYYPAGIQYVDWMGYPITNKNKPSYHHIEKAEDLRKNHKDDTATVENGAILGKKSHEILHQLEHKDPELYECWNYLFLVINRMGIYPIDDVWEMITILRIKTQDVLYSKGKTLELSKNN